MTQMLIDIMASIYSKIAIGFSLTVLFCGFMHFALQYINEIVGSIRDKDITFVDVIYNIVCTSLYVFGAMFFIFLFYILVTNNEFSNMSNVANVNHTQANELQHERADSSQKAWAERGWRGWGF